MTGFNFEGALRVCVAGTGGAIDYARDLLTRLGVQCLDRDDAGCAEAPLIVSGDAFPLGSAPPPNPHIVRLWNFHVGVAGDGVQASAVSGVSWVLGIPSQAPLYLPAEIPEKWCGCLGASMILTAFVERLTLARGHEGQRIVDVSAAELLRGFADQNFGNHKQIPTSWRRNGRVSPEHGGIYPQGFYPCKDGFVGVVGRSRQDWAAMLAALDNPAWATEEFRNPFALARHSDKVDPLFSGELAKFTRAELLERALASGATFAPVYHGSEVRAHEIVRPDYFGVDGACGLPFETIGQGVRATTVAPRPAEKLSGPYFPLQGLRVMEFCWVWAGPCLGQFLADLGAEVIKIEWYDRFDLYRTRGIERLRGKIDDVVYREMSPSFHSLNRNKIGLAVNLKAPEGVEVVRRLAASTDLVIENWSSGTLERLGVGYAALKAANPELLMLSLSAFGPSSRLADMRSYGLVTSSLAGAEAQIKVGEEFVGSPTFNISDPNAALFGLLGALAGIIQGRGAGTGSHLVVSQVEAVMTLMEQSRPGAPSAARHAVCETRDGAFVAVTVPDDGETVDPASWCRSRTADEAVADIASIGGHAARIVNVVDSADVAVFQDLEVRLGAEHPVTGREELIAAPWRINGRRAPLRKTAPLMAEGNQYVLRSILGLSSDEIKALAAQGAV